MLRIIWCRPAWFGPLYNSCSVVHYCIQITVGFIPTYRDTANMVRLVCLGYSVTYATGLRREHNLWSMRANRVKRDLQFDIARMIENKKIDRKE